MSLSEHSLNTGVVRKVLSNNFPSFNIVSASRPMSGNPEGIQIPDPHC